MLFSRWVYVGRSVVAVLFCCCFLAVLWCFFVGGFWMWNWNFNGHHLKWSFMGEGRDKSKRQGESNQFLV